MPIYGYSCSCGHNFDKLQKMDAPTPACPNCQRGEVSRQVSAAAVRLKGSGWYETDFKSASEKRRNLANPDIPAPSKPNSPGI